METRVALLEQTVCTIAATLERIERRSHLGLAQADNRMDRSERRLDIIGPRRQGDFRWLLGLMCAGFGATRAGFGTVGGVMAHGLHWL
ncbi:MAG TPA: hypothetical protein VK726_02580 [Acetobacteraceae bacterium]|nr:hypothetical protein [Acetobacteraceae bacterium]